MVCQELHKWRGKETPRGHHLCVALVWVCGPCGKLPRLRDLKNRSYPSGSEVTPFSKSVFAKTSERSDTSRLWQIDRVISFKHVHHSWGSGQQHAAPHSAVPALAFALGCVAATCDCSITGCPLISSIVRVGSRTTRSPLVQHTASPAMPISRHLQALNATHRVMT